MAYLCNTKLEALYIDEQDRGFLCLCILLFGARLDVLIHESRVHTLQVFLFFESS